MKKVTFKAQPKAVDPRDAWVGAAPEEKAAQQAQEARAGGAEEPMKRFTIDVHQHYQQRPFYFESLLTFFRERNAMACCNGFRAQYPAIIEAAKKNPETIIPFGRLVFDETPTIAIVFTVVRMPRM